MVPEEDQKKIIDKNEVFEQFGFIDTSAIEDSNK
jgi:hypothetical protein